MTRKEAIRFLVMRTLGNFLVLFALYGAAATFGPALYYEIQYRVIQLRGVHFTVSAQDSNIISPLSDSTKTVGSPSFADVLAGAKEQILIPKDTQFSILIPKIGASAKIIPNVDPLNQNAFLPILQQGIAHAKGTVFPGMKGTIYLFAHSTDNWWDVGRYNAVFYLLKDLSPGDEIIVFFENSRHEYVVTQNLILDPNNVSLLTSPQAGEERLVMQTCWPPGTTWKRLYVIAKPTSNH